MASTIAYASVPARRVCAPSPQAAARASRATQRVRHSAHVVWLSWLPCTVSECRAPRSRTTPALVVASSRAAASASAIACALALSVAASAAPPRVPPRPLPRQWPLPPPMLIRAVGAGGAGGLTSSGARARGVEKLVHGRTCQQVVMRRHRTCVHRRARWRAPPWGTQRRTRHRRMTTVSSTSRFRRRRRPLSVRWLRARHAKEARAAAKTSYGSNADLARPTDKSPTKASVRPKRSTSVGAKAQSASHHRVKVDGVGDAARRDRAGQRRV